MNQYTSALRITGIVLVVYALLVATHLGEFWPFSIYPMFSQAGNGWTRAVVRVLPSDEPASWEPVPISRLPGTPFRVEPRGITQSDLANYVSKTEQWTPQRLKGLRSLFAGTYAFSSPLLVMRVDGRMVDDSVAVEATPLILFTDTTAHLNPTTALRPDSARASPPTGAVR